MELRDRTLLLTGATGGLGRAIAAATAAKGARLVLSSRHGDQLEQLGGSLPGGGHRTIVADLVADGEAERLVAEAGELDGMIANAGIGANGRVDQIEGDRANAVMRLNFEAPILMARAIAPSLRERGSGHLVFIASLAAKGSTGRHALYAGTKAGLRSFAIGLRDDLARDGVGVSIVCPGFIREAGMFAEAGESPPMNLGTAAPGEVGAAVVRAIERDRLEVDVAPWRQRAMANFAHRRPALAEKLIRRLT
jgi:short-subunit dehydrogenase